jgi:hypothetical protein
MPLFSSQQQENGNKTTDKLTTARSADSNPADHITCFQRSLNDDAMTATTPPVSHLTMTHIAVARRPKTVPPIAVVAQHTITLCITMEAQPKIAPRIAVVAWHMMTPPITLAAWQTMTPHIPVATW